MQCVYFLDIYFEAWNKELCWNAESVSLILPPSLLPIPSFFLYRLPPPLSY